MGSSELYDASNPLSMGNIVGNDQGLVTITLAATATLLHKVKFEATADIVAIMLNNTGVTKTVVNIGNTSTGLASGVFTQRMPGIVVLPGANIFIPEDWIAPLFEHFSDDTNILCQMSAATTSLEIMLRLRQS